MTATFPTSRIELGLQSGLGTTMDWYLGAPATTDDQGNLLPEVAESLAEMEGSEPWPTIVRDNATILAQAGMQPGEDFVVLPYVGTPQSISQNAANARRHGTQGVEISSVLKSFAGVVQLESGEERTVVLTGPGDLSFRTTGLIAGQVGEMRHMTDEEMEAHGFVHGTVNPVKALLHEGQTDPNATIYLFDRDLVDSTTRVADTMTYISGGDTGWSVALDIRKLIAAAYSCEPNRVTQDICERGPEQERLIARNHITLFSGDSPQVGFGYNTHLEAAVRVALQEAGAYHGDVSMPDMDLLSRRYMAGTGALALHGAEVIVALQDEIRGLPRLTAARRLVAFTSNAANSDMVTSTLREGVFAERDDMELVTVRDALDAYIVAQEDLSDIMVLGLPDVVAQYPGMIHTTGVVKPKEVKLPGWMHTARSGDPEAIAKAGADLRLFVERQAKTQMAKTQGLQGKEIGEFMKRDDVQLEGTVVLAGTELWDLLEAQDWKNGFSEHPELTLIDPIKLLMDHLATRSFA